jgi:hypothetical protein
MHAGLIEYFFTVVVITFVDDDPKKCGGTLLSTCTRCPRITEKQYQLTRFCYISLKSIGGQRR